MGKIFYLIGKTASGKDTLYRRILENCPELRTYTMYSTRPMRPGEQNGSSYYFVTEQELLEFEKKGELIEKRIYQTILGPWTYATVDDGQIDLSAHDYLLGSGTLESYVKMREYYGAERLVPLYIASDDGARLLRSVKREMLAEQPNYKEVCRRFLSDEADFAPEKLVEAGIGKIFRNDDLECCLEELIGAIRKSTVSEAH